MANEHDILPPRYRDPRRIGHGGMGEIFRAEDEVLGRTVAIKVLAERYARDESLRARFTREALAAARLSGEPGAITIFDVGDWHDRPFIVMEYLEGGSLEERLRTAQPSPPGARLARGGRCSIGRRAPERRRSSRREAREPAARSERWAPRRRLRHRERGRARLADDGRNGARHRRLSVARTGQGRACDPGQRPLRARRVVAFELLTARRPFESDSATAEAAAHVHAEVPSVERLDPVFRRALAKIERTVQARPSSWRRCATLCRGRRRRASCRPSGADRRFRWWRRSSSRRPSRARGGGDPGEQGGREERSAGKYHHPRDGHGAAASATAPPPPPPAPPPPVEPVPPPVPAGGGNGVALTDQATRLLEARTTPPPSAWRDGLSLRCGGAGRSTRRMRSTTSGLPSSGSTVVTKHCNTSTVRKRSRATGRRSGSSEGLRRTMTACGSSSRAQRASSARTSSTTGSSGTRTTSVVALDLLTYAGNRANLEVVEDRVPFVQADIADLDIVENVLREHEIEVVVNFAAESHNSLAIIDPGKFFPRTCSERRRCSRLRAGPGPSAFITSRRARSTETCRSSRRSRSPRNRRTGPGRRTTRRRPAAITRCAPTSRPGACR